MFLEAFLKKSGCWKRAVEFKGGSLHVGFDGLGGLQRTLPSLCLSYNIQKIQCEEAAVTVLAVSAVVPPFRIGFSDILKINSAKT